MQNSILASALKNLLVSTLLGTVAFVGLDNSEMPLMERWLTLGLCIGVAVMVVAGVQGCWIWLEKHRGVDKRQPLLLGREQSASGGLSPRRSDASDQNGEEIGTKRY